ncbi:putative methyltransferase DDB_G0268948 [Styela clava]
MEARLYQNHHVAELFVKDKITYPDILKKFIIDFLLRLDPDRKSDQLQFDLMLDMGCANGLQTKIFAEHFSKVIGIDKSEEQIKMAIKENSSDNIQYVIGDESNMPALDNTVDLVWCCFAFHYMNVETYIRECERVLKSTGGTIICGHDFVDIMLHENEGSQLQSGMNILEQYLR